MDYFTQNLPASQIMLSNYQFSKQIEKMRFEFHFENRLEKALWELYQISPVPQALWQENVLPSPPKIDLVPAILQDICNVLAKRYNYDPGEVIWPVLSAINAAVNGRFFVQIKLNWREPVCLYIVLSKESGAIKSGLIMGIMTSVTAYGDELISGCKNNDIKLRSIAALSKANEKELVELLKRCSKNGDCTPYLTAVDINKKEERQLYQELNAYYTPPLVYGTDMSLATVSGQLSGHGGSFNIISTEDWFAKAKLDTSSQHINILLNAYDAEPSGYTKPGGKYVLIKNPMLNIFTLVQPEKLYKHFAKARKTDNGFFNRVIVCICQDKRQMVPLYDEEPVTAAAEESVEEFHKRIGSLVRTYFSQDMDRKLYTLKFSPAAVKRIEQYQHLLDQFYSNYLQQSNTVHCIDDGYIQKDRGAVARVAALFHIIENYLNPCADEVSVENVNAACSILYPMIFHHEYANASELRRLAYNAVRIINWFCKHEFYAFTLDNIRSNLNNISTDECKEALALLERYHWTKVVQIAGTKPAYVVNPQVMPNFRF